VNGVFYLGKIFMKVLFMVIVARLHQTPRKAEKEIGCGKDAIV
jgi:hypothetical protein